ncbi:MAG: DUF2971 domain-containing protein [Chlorobium phaeobacteroides]|nr:DUF2971 domain-containing protein [Chlorobium phaeobacteroides]
MDKPKTIYKYASFSAQSLRNLKAQSVYFGSPLGFNDPYDCALKAGVTHPSDSDVEALRASYAVRPDVPPDIQKLFAQSSTADLREIVMRNALQILDKHAEGFLRERGVTCFSECNNDLLMWSHYGGRYKGFCLGFSTSYEPFSKIRRVEYAEEMPKIDAVDALMHGNFDQMVDLFCTKSRSWAYEKEWRCLHQVAGTLFTYEAEALESVFFGPDIDLESLEIICLILAGQNPNVRFWRGHRSNERFEVAFEEFTYTSYLEAKKQGIIT